MITNNASYTNGGAKTTLHPQRVRCAPRVLLYM
nr:MAG TPA: hypothetical protein [Caudoviricetes sp.]